MIGHVPIDVSVMSTDAATITYPSSAVINNDTVAKKGVKSHSSNAIYRVGDYVYFETNSSSTYAIRRIEELRKVTPPSSSVSSGGGTIEARVMCFLRRSELPQQLLNQCDSEKWGELSNVVSSSQGEHFSDDEDDSDGYEDDLNSDEMTVENGELSNLEKTKKVLRRKRKLDRHLLKLREVFLTRQVETLPATLIRGKCSVTLLSEIETINSYIQRDNAFFYSLVYDPVQRTLVADRGEIRIGSSYQASIPSVSNISSSESEPGTNLRNSDKLETNVWSAEANVMSEELINKVVVLSKSVGTFARALDCPSVVRQPSLHLSVASACRDATLTHAHSLIHNSRYDFTETIKCLVPDSGLALCRDELDDWSPSEAQLFEQGLSKVGKDFDTIHRDYLSWKSMRQIIEYFFMWKTTDRYVKQKRAKMLKNEAKVKQVYVPPYINKSTRFTGSSGEIIVRGMECDAYTSLTKYSWLDYKKYGRYRHATSSYDSFVVDCSTAINGSSSIGSNRVAIQNNPLINNLPPSNNNKHQNPQRLLTTSSTTTIEEGSGVTPSSLTSLSLNSQSLNNKARNSFYLRTVPMMRAARRMTSVSKVRSACRKPKIDLDMKTIRQELQSLIPTVMTDLLLEKLNTFSKRERPPINSVVCRMNSLNRSSNPSAVDDHVDQVAPDNKWLILTPHHELVARQRSQPQAYPPPMKRSDGSYIFQHPTKTSNSIPQNSSRSHIPNIVPPKDRMATLTRILQQQQQNSGNGGTMKLDGLGRPITSSGHGFANSSAAFIYKRQIISWMNAPQDIFYKASTHTKQRVRGQFSQHSIRKIGRNPFKASNALI